MMKQKKIIVPILTLAVMLLMVGGVYAVFSSTQPEKSKAENVRDTTDQDYEKGLTEEQKAFNELINKQIYEETANNLEQYEQYGKVADAHKPGRLSADDEVFWTSWAIYARRGINTLWNYCAVHD